MRNADGACETLSLGLNEPTPHGLVLSIGCAGEVLENKIHLRQSELLHIVLERMTKNEKKKAMKNREQMWTVKQCQRLDTV